MSSVECRHLSFFTFRSSGKKRVKRGEDESCSMPAGIFRQSFRLLLPLSFLSEEEENSRVIKMDDDDAEIIVSHALKYAAASILCVNAVSRDKGDGREGNWSETARRIEEGGRLHMR